MDALPIAPASVAKVDDESHRHCREAGKRGCNMAYIVKKRLGAGMAVFAFLLLVRVALGRSTLETPAPANGGPAKPLSAQQLDNLVAPIACYIRIRC